MTERLVKVYSLFNRVWHWSQVASILILLFTGFRVMGLHTLIPFRAAVVIHTAAALALLLLWAFATFWLFTTGAWRQFIPTRTGLRAVLRFYAWGVFRGEEHPYQKRLRARHNPLQAASYLALKLVLFPAIWSTGIVYLLHGAWMHLDPGGQGLWLVANLHVLAGFAIAAFVVVHVYLLTIGHGFREHVRPMITGFETVALTPEQEAYLRSDEPGRLKG